MLKKSGSGITKSPRSLTFRAIEAMRSEEVPYRVPDTRCRGLSVRVATNGVRTFDLAYRVKGGGVRRKVLGRFPDMSLEQAREDANALTGAARKGRDVIAEAEAAEKAAAARVSVSGLIDAYMKRARKDRLRTAGEMESRLRRALKDLLEDPAADIRRRDIRVLLNEVSDSGREREAEKRRQVIGAMYRWALSEDMVEVDPTAGLKAYDAGTPRDRVLSDDEVCLLWPWLASDMPPEHADILRLQLCLGARCGEVAGMRAEEVDVKEWLWTLPGARSKNKRSRATPLVGTARAIVEAKLGKSSGALFRSETGTPLSASHVGAAILVRAKRLPIAKFTTHDLRRTMATDLVEMGISLDLVAAVIGHEPGAKNTRTLVRHYVKTDQIDRKRTTLEAWDARLLAIVAGRSRAPNVVPLRTVENS